MRDPTNHNKKPSRSSSSAVYTRSTVNALHFIAPRAPETVAIFIRQGDDLRKGLNQLLGYRRIHTGLCGDVRALLPRSVHPESNPSPMHQVGPRGTAVVLKKSGPWLYFSWPHAMLSKGKKTKVALTRPRLCYRHHSRRLNGGSVSRGENIFTPPVTQL